MVTSKMEPSNKVTRAKAAFETEELEDFLPLDGLSVSLAVGVFVSAGILENYTNFQVNDDLKNYI